MADKGAQALLGELQEVRDAQGATQPDPNDQPIEDRLQELGIDPASLAQASDDDLKAVADRLFTHGQRKVLLSKFFAPLPGGGFDWTTDPQGKPTGLDQNGKPVPAAAPDNDADDAAGGAGAPDADADDAAAATAGPAGAGPASPGAPPAGPGPGAMPPMPPAGGPPPAGAATPAPQPLRVKVPTGGPGPQGKP